MIAISTFIYHPLRRVEPSVATKLEYIQGGGFRLPIIMGMPITGFGLFLLGYTVAFACGKIPKATPLNTFGSVLVVLTLSAFALVFSSAGLWFIFGRTTLILDKGAATVTMRRSFLSLKRTVVDPLAGFTHVEVIRRFDEGVFYSVSLIGPAVTRRLASTLDQATAERAAGEVSEFLALPVQARDGR